ncbi:MAG: hypothetical protein ACOY46_12680 [Bacillota bacterium]
MKKKLHSCLVRNKIYILLVSVLSALSVLLVLPVYLGGEPDPVPGPEKRHYEIGQEVPPDILKPAISLSAGQKLSLDEKYYLFFSNAPEMPTEPGILFSVEDAMSPSGMVRVLFSHLNLLIDWKSRPIKNISATAGFCVENRTRMKLDIYAERSSIAVNRSPDGRMLFLEDAAPVKPGEKAPQYYGSAVGNWMVQQWFLSEKKQPVLVGRVHPGERAIISGDVGPRGWITGIYDLKFYDSATGLQVGKLDFKTGEKIGIKTFIAPVNTDLNAFLDKMGKQGKVLPPGKNDRMRMRGLFIPGKYEDNPSGEAITKKYDIYYDSSNGNASSFALAAGEYDQCRDSETPYYVSDVFQNDNLRNGFDPGDRSAKGVNGGNYGVEYIVNLNINGPAALVAQGAVRSGPTGEIDMHNQILTFELDGKVNTIQIKDPNFNKFYSDRSVLRPIGYGKVVAVFPEKGKTHHLLRFTLPPNGYGPVRFYLMPML